MTLSRFLLLLLLISLSSGCNLFGDRDPANPNAPTPGDAVFYTAVGASDALGIGSSVPCLPLTPCENGRGYVALIARRLRETRTVTLTNLGIPAAVLSPRLQALGAQYGRDVPGNFIEREMPFVPRTTTVATVFAGANDANVIGTAILGGAAGADVNGYIDSQVRQFADEYQTLVRGIRDRAAGVRIVVSNLPNMGAMPFAAAYPLSHRRYLERISVRLTTGAINPLAAQGVAVVDMMCDDRFMQAGAVSSDGFHPSDTGYQLLADRMYEAISAGMSPAPRSGCALMDVVP
jgi:lysophospholipase L1-like esterase